MRCPESLKALLREAEHNLESGDAAELSSSMSPWRREIEGPVELFLFGGPDGERVDLRG
jgi:hypothetical protein